MMGAFSCSSSISLCLATIAEFSCRVNWNSKTSVGRVKGSANSGAQLRARCASRRRRGEVRPFSHFVAVSRNGDNRALESTMPQNEKTGLVNGVSNRRMAGLAMALPANTPPRLLTERKKEEGDVLVEEDDDYPLWMEEDDPYWPEDDPDGEGVGFQVSNFFEPKIMNVNEDGSPDGEALNLDWEAEQYQWIVREITSAEWEPVVREDPTPLIFFAFERYGPSGPECWKLLVELEKVLHTIVGSRKYPIRAVKLDISSEPAVGAALKIKTLPALLFINGGKLLYRLYGVKTEQELLAITSHLFYHSARPDFMDEVETSHTVTSISSSG